MAKSLEGMTAEELAEELESLDSVIEADQNTVADAKRRLRLHARMRENILNTLAASAMRKGW